MVRMANVKMPRLLAFARHVQDSHYQSTEAEECNINGKPDTSHYNRYSGILEKNPPCNAEDNLRAGLIVIEAWFGGY